jgi:peptidyl-prolyl cis-trans isomerase SurA
MSYATPGNSRVRRGYNHAAARGADRFALRAASVAVHSPRPDAGPGSHLTSPERSKIALMRRFVAPLAAFLLVSPHTLPAQDAPVSGRQLIDRVVAVVGDTVLLMSDVQAELQQLQAAGRAIPEDDQGRARMIQQIVDSRIDDLVLLTAAKSAGVDVREEEITQLVDQQVRTAQQQFRTEAEFRQALAASGLSMEQYRALAAQQYAAQTRSQRFLQQRMAGAIRPAVTEAELREAWEAQRGMLGERPATVSFQQVLIDVRPSEEAMAEARRRGAEVLEELRAGGSFEVLARRYSEDPGSRDQGGDLGWFRRGRMVPAFENVVWSLRPGDTSGLVETDFGYHIIRLERVRGGERQARHILIRPQVSTAEQQLAWERADSVATAARAGAPFQELVRRYPTPGENRIDRVPLDRLPPVYGSLLGETSAGDVVGPFEDEGPSGSRWVVARITERGQAGEWSFDEVRDDLRERIQEQKMIDQIVADLRRSTYVNVML